MDIRKILDSWSLGSIKNIKKAKMGVVNHNWIIETSSGNYVLRILPKGKKLKDLMFELKYIDILSKEGFGYQLPYALKTKKGDEIIKSGENYIWLYRFIEGHVKNSFGEEELKEMGKMMANYHRILEKISLKNGAGKSKPYVKDLILKETEGFKKSIFNQKKNKEDIIYLKEIEKLLPILEKLDSSKYGKLKQYPIHRDLNPENVLWQDKKLIGIVDFENVSMNEPLIKDLSIVLQLGCAKDGGRLNVSKARHFIKEYIKFRRISVEELRLLPSIITAAYIEDFNYAYWMLKNDPERAKLYRLKKYSNSAQWYWKNNDKISGVLLK